MIIDNFFIDRTSIQNQKRLHRQMRISSGTKSIRFRNHDNEHDHDDDDAVISWYGKWLLGPSTMEYTEQRPGKRHTNWGDTCTSPPLCRTQTYFYAPTVIDFVIRNRLISNFLNQKFNLVLLYKMIRRKTGLK